MKFAVSVTDLSGEKRDVSFMSIDVRNVEKDDKGSFEKIVIETISSNKGFLGNRGRESEILALFMEPLDAIKAGLEIVEKTGPVNVIMGIGIHTSPTLINESDVLRYVTMGNAVTIARSISHKSKNNLIITKDTKAKVGAEVKIEKKDDDFLVKGISRREDFRKDVERIVKGIKSEGKGFEVVR